MPAHNDSIVAKLRSTEPIITTLIPGIATGIAALLWKLIQDEETIEWILMIVSTLLTAVGVALGRANVYSPKTHHRLAADAHSAGIEQGLVDSSEFFEQSLDEAAVSEFDREFALPGDDVLDS